MKRTRIGNKFRNAVTSWLGIPIDLQNTAFWSDFGGRNSNAGQAVNYDKAMTLSTVWSCVRLIAESISTLPLTLYKITPTGNVPAVDHPLYNVLRLQPNVNTTATVHWEAQIAAQLLRGWGCAEKLMVGKRVVGLSFLDPQRMYVRMVKGEPIYQYTDRDGSRRIIPSSRIFAIPGFTLNGVDGLSAIQYGYNVFGSALAAEQASGKTFENGLMPTTYFYMDRVLKKDQRDTFRNTTMPEITGAMNAGKPPLLEAGMKAGTIGINPTDAQLLESRSFSVEEICRWFRVPPWMVGHAGSGATKWGTGMEQELLGFLTFTLRPWLLRTEQAVYKDLLTPAEKTIYYARYDLADFLRADSAARASFFSLMVNNGIMTRDEVREQMNMQRRGGNADVLTVQTALAPLDNIGQSSSNTEAALALLGNRIMGGSNEK